MGHFISVRIILGPVDLGTPRHRHPLLQLRLSSCIRHQSLGIYLYAIPQKEQPVSSLISKVRRLYRILDNGTLSLVEPGNQGLQKHATTTNLSTVT